jgi:hypothetical protein
MNISTQQEENILKKAKAIINKTMHKYNLEYKESYKYLYYVKIDFNEGIYRKDYKSLENEFDVKNRIKYFDNIKFRELFNKREDHRKVYRERFTTKNPQLKDEWSIFHDAFDKLDFIIELNNNLSIERKKEKEYNEKAKIEHELKKELYVIDRIKKRYNKVISYDKKSKIMYHEASSYDTTKKHWGIIYRQFECNLNEVNMWLNVRKAYNIKQALQNENKERSKKYVELNKDYLRFLSIGEVIDNDYQKAKLIALELWVLDSLNQLNDLLVDEILSPERSGPKKELNCKQQ